MTDSDRARRQRELSDMDRDFQRRQREFREDLNQRRNEELTGVLDKANRAIKAIAEREKFDLILQDAVYVSPRLDITDTVIKQLNSGR
jgi:probable outer membrane chaperone, skp-related transmembrane protein